ncbi:O-phospho-L-seryl-tRNASec:L-selenocysteinyl-tRNA synthase [Fasciolopsis buskii]|uniref:O-phosphoseryl-tRNA(Sec) selenium transferase n=1 Tax=Fasciolopsis buskii TaxID=27845 RepID=A0A8E0RL06_9TREM|nr:O-phospho-L-seryl-tRNASec:L-selenocysteinyl-tRNA synthase [Fasciolopsis buski]
MLDENNLSLLRTYIGDAYVTRSRERLAGVRRKFERVLEEGRLPEQGFAESDIEAFFLQLSSMDSNNWENSVGVGEREGRVLLNLVRRRHFGLIHGIGRSGDIAVIQPKAAGSSVVNRLTNQLLLDWLRKSGAPSTAHCILVPMATGMSLTLCLLTLRKRRPAGARYVIWPRIDQKSCFKCILAAGLIPIPIEPHEGPTDPKRSVECADQLGTNMVALTEALCHPGQYLLKHWPEGACAQGVTEASAIADGPDSVICVLSTTLCFSPRVPDRLHAITKLCSTHGVSHLINNAYGVQSPRCMRMIESCGKLLLSTATGTLSLTTKRTSDGDVTTGGTQITGRPIDLLYVQSTDKNLLVPVGGAIVAGFDAALVAEVAKTYPGRASATPSIDALASLLHLGLAGWTELIERRSACFARLRDGLQSVAQKHGLRLLHTEDNPISLAISLNELCDLTSSADNVEPSANRLRCLTQLGSQLFTQGCSGVRVVLPASASDAVLLGGYKFPGFASHSSNSRVAYMNAAAAIGQTVTEVDVFLSKLDKALTQFRKSQSSRQSTSTFEQT